MSRSLEGSVFRSKDKRGWQARLRYTDATGNPREKKRTVKTHAQAVAKIAELKREIEGDKADRKTYGQLDAAYRREDVHAAVFVDGKKVSGFRQNTATVERYLDRALQFFGDDRYLDAISYSDCKEYKRFVVSLPLVDAKGNIRPGQRSLSDIHHHLKRARRLFYFATEKGWLVKNPFELGRPLIVESFEVERTRTLSQAEEARLISACKLWRRHIIPIIVVAIETAMRRGELQALRWSEVNFEGRCIRVEGTTTKTLKTRLVPMSDRTSKTLAELWQNSKRRQSALVFGESDFKKGFNGACRAAELEDVHFHDLRHTAITRWLAKGATIAEAMKASGHSQMKTFLRYVNQSETSVFEFSQKLDKAA